MRATFRENDVDAELLPTLTADDLKDLGVSSLGHRRRFLQAIAELRDDGAPPPPAVSMADDHPVSTYAGRTPPAHGDVLRPGWIDGTQRKA